MSSSFWQYCYEVCYRFEQIFGFPIDFLAKPGYDRVFRGAWKDGWTAEQVAAYVGNDWDFQPDKQ